MRFTLKRQSSTVSTNSADSLDKRKARLGGERIRKRKVKGVVPISNIEASCKLLEKRFNQICSASNDDTFYTTGLSTVVYRDIFIHLSIDMDKKVLIISTSFVHFGVKVIDKANRTKMFNNLPHLNRGCVLELKGDDELRLSKAAPMSCLQSNVDFETVFTSFILAARAARRIAD